ncbi:hypothetical protein [Sinorhizobium meliloti]|uniref:hypothetical protein n=1 Tax=Rhizobium meliloti TaxID=382 RepID=UPI0002F2BED7|nr:hypothetical protein [Sinorhizobium meliloti]
MPYLVLPYDSGPLGLPGMQALINEKAAEGYALLQVIERSTYHWVLIFRRRADDGGENG